MFDITLGATIAAVSGPALLTNASALLLGGASNRYHSAIEARRHQGADPSLSTRRILLSATAVHALHLALIAFAFDCALLLFMTAGGSAFDRMESILNAGGTVLAFVGFAALMAGVVLLALEGLFGYKASSGCMLRAYRRHVDS